MKTLQQFFVMILLALALSVPAYAGDMGSPTTTNPAPSAPTSDNTNAQPPALPSVVDPTPTLIDAALSVFQRALSVY